MRALCAQWDFRYGEFGSHRKLKLRWTELLMVTWQSLSVCDYDSRSSMSQSRFGAIRISHSWYNKTLILYNLHVTGVFGKSRLGQKSYRGNEYTRNNRRIVGRVISFAVRDVSKEGRWLILPRTSYYWYYNIQKLKITCKKDGTKTSRKGPRLFIEYCRNWGVQKTCNGHGTCGPIEQSAKVCNIRKEVFGNN
jgi:hypothetical protein